MQVAALKTQNLHTCAQQLKTWIKVNFEHDFFIESLDTLFDEKYKNAPEFFW